MYDLFLLSKAARQCVLYAKKHPEVDEEDLLKECFKAYQEAKGWDANTWIDNILSGTDHELMKAFVWPRASKKYFWGRIHQETCHHV